MYRDRMIGYYPQVIQAIKEFQAIIDAEAPEYEDLSIARDKLIEDAYLTTMNEERIAQWETLLGIRPLVDSTVDDRRDTVLARIRAKGKLNTEMINTIVNTFTGGTAESWIENSILYVEITPPPTDKSFQFPNVVQELTRKVPAHLGISVQRSYNTWGEIKENYSTWGKVNNTFANWTDVLITVRTNDVTEIVLWEQVDATPEKANDILFTYTFINEGHHLTLGQTYTVVWDGIEYPNLVAWNSDGIVTVGARFGATTSDLPFSIFENVGNAFIVTHIAGNHTFKVTTPKI